MKKITKQKFELSGKRPVPATLFNAIGELSIDEALEFTEEEWGKEYHPTNYINRYFERKNTGRVFRTKSGFENGISMYYCLRIK